MMIMGGIAPNSSEPRHRDGLVDLVARPALCDMRSKASRMLL